MLDSDPGSIIWEAPCWFSSDFRNADIEFEYIERKLKRERMILESKRASKNADICETENNILYLEGLLG